MRRPDLKTVAPHPERPTLEPRIVAPVLLCHQVGNHLPLVIHPPGFQILGHRAIGLDRADTVNAGHRRDDHHIVPFQQRPGGRVAHPVDLFVDLAFLLDIGVRPRHIGLGLIVIVIAYEILNRVLGEEPLEFAVQLRGQRLVRGQDDRRALRLLYDLGHGECLAGPGRAQQHLVPLPFAHAARQFGDGGRLVTRRLEPGVHDKPLAPFKLGARAHLFKRLWHGGRGGHGRFSGCASDLSPNPRLSTPHPPGVLTGSVSRMHKMHIIQRHNPAFSQIAKKAHL